MCIIKRPQIRCLSLLDRERVWSQLQEERVARFPGAEGRIPNFMGAEACARVLSQVQFWRDAKVLKATPIRLRERFARKPLPTATAQGLKKSINHPSEGFCKLEV